MPSAEQTRRAEARIEAPVDIGLLLQRTARMTEGLLDLLQADYVEFQSKKAGVPKGFLDNLQGLTKTLNDLTLAHSRYRKTEAEWSDQLSTEEKLTNLQDFLLSVFKDSPQRIVDWMARTALLLNRAGDTTLAVRRAQVAATLTVDQKLEAKAIAAPMSSSWSE